VALAEIDGLHTLNMHGGLPLIDDNPTQPNEAYFAHIDAVIEIAASLGLYIGMLPTWGDKWNKKWGVGPEIFTPENARSYGIFLGRRYPDQPIIWILGGDRPIESEDHRATIEAIAYQVRDVFDVMRAEAGTELKVLLADGGASQNDMLMQFQADIIGRPVLRNRSADASALGAAYLAGLASGIWQTLDQIEDLPRLREQFEPQMSVQERATRAMGWKTAIARVTLGTE
jgi:sugar (pentulose or hexulose) kinase